MDTADIIDKAADLLWLRGRCIGFMEDADGRLCIRGAIHEAEETNCCTHPAERVVGRYLVAHPDLLQCERDDEFQAFVEDEGYYPAWIWNDSLPVNPDNDALVIDTLRRCSKELRESA